MPRRNNPQRSSLDLPYARNRIGLHEWVPPLGEPSASYVRDRRSGRLRLVSARLPQSRLLDLQAALNSRKPPELTAPRASTSAGPITTRSPRGRFAKSA